MREYSTPPRHASPADGHGSGGDSATVTGPLPGNVTDDVVANAEHAPDAVVLSRRPRPQVTGSPPPGEPRDPAWEDVTTTGFLAEVRATAKGLVAAGVEPGDRVLLVARTRWEWTVLDYAIWFAGAVSVPVYATAPADQVRRVVTDCGARVAVVETPAQRDVVTAAGVEAVWTIDPSTDTATAAGSDGALAELSVLGGDLDDDALEERRTSREGDDLATLLYTSGTTGTPRGCMLTHANLRHELDAAVGALDGLFGQEECTLLFLPLAHVFARVVQLGCVSTRTRLGHSPDAGRLVEDLADFRPTFVLAVPRVFERVFNTASQQATADGLGVRFDRAAESAIAWSRGLDRGGPRLAARARQAMSARLVHTRVRDVFGGRCRHAIAGGAPLGERLSHFYRGIGLTVLEGYGLTETTAALSVNLPQAHKIGTVGRPLPGTTVRVADDGELLVRGGQVFAGYWQDPTATAEVLEPDGWLHTGDVGEVDDEGFVRVTGRKNEILVTAGGKNVAPAVLEDRIRAHPLVSQALVVGDGQPFVAALVTVDDEAFAAWLARRGGRGTVADHVDDPALVAEVQRAVDEANKGVSRAESVRRFRVLPRDWSEEAGELTPSLKLRRTVVTRSARAEIARLYRP